MMHLQVRLSNLRFSDSHLLENAIQQSRLTTAWEVKLQGQIAANSCKCLCCDGCVVIDGKK